MKSGEKCVENAMKHPGNPRGGVGCPPHHMVAFFILKGWVNDPNLTLVSRAAI